MEIEKKDKPKNLEQSMVEIIERMVQYIDQQDSKEEKE